MTLSRSRLLFPDEPTAGGPPTGTAPAPKAPGSTDGSPPSPSPAPSGAPPEPAGRMISDAEYQQMQRDRARVQESSRLFGQLQRLGYNRFDDAVQALEQSHRLRQDPRMAQVLDLLGREPDADGSADGTSKPLTREDVTQAFEEMYRQREGERMGREVQSGQKTQSRLVNRALSGHETLGTFFKGTTFEDALEGKGTPVAGAVAEIFEAELLRRQPQRDGRLLPLTDSDLIAEAREATLMKVNALRAATLVAAAPGQADSLTPRSAPTGPTHGQPTDQSRRQAISATFAEEIQRGRAARDGAPASQGV